MVEVIRLPVTKINKKTRRVMDRAYEWESSGFSGDVATAAAAIMIYANQLERRVIKLEKTIKSLKEETPMKKKAIGLKKQIAMGENPAVSGNANGPMPMMKSGGMVKCYKKGGKVKSKSKK